MTNLKERFSRLRSHIADIAFKHVSNRLNSNKRYLSAVEIFLPNNQIFSKLNLLFPTYELRPSRKIITKFPSSLTLAFEKDSTLKRSRAGSEEKRLAFLFLAPLNFGIYPNLDMKFVKNALEAANYEVCWQELKGNFLQDLNKVRKNLELFQSKGVSKVFILVDVLAAPHHYPEYLKVLEIRESISDEWDVHFVALVGDIWRNKDMDGIKRASDFVDLFVHNDIAASKGYPDYLQAKMAFFPYAALDDKLFQPASSKNGSLFFSGQIRDSDRRVWLQRTVKYTKKEKVGIQINVWSSASSSGYKNYEDYAYALNNASFCLSLSRRGLDHWILTARAHQAVRSGATLIQEVGASFDPWLDMLVPWKHYVPFHDRDSLKEAIKYLGQDLPNARNLGIQAREVYRRRFTMQNFVGLMDQQ